MTPRFSSLLRIVLVAAGLASALSACVPLMVGTGAAVGAMVATDPRTTGTQLEDEGIELRASSRIRDALGDRVHVNITSYSRQVLITGEVPTEADKLRVQNIVREVPNVKSVVNALGIMPNSTLSERSNDTYITGKVRAKLVDLNDLVATNAFKVVTERGEVFLMGHVTQYQSAQLTEAARSIDGVRKVVRVFEIVPGSAPAPAASPAAAPAPVTSPAESGGVTVTPIPATNLRTEN
ncbi:BON domain-containing protein [Comamonas sp. NLF-1-9]|uniref:BON domain-containing protein n=1 Tax=Comamonas sp. NLF-1-9 TaxID=2853163 RepID=UPI001C47300F|nr:BON domain-containing protein [Comamonas sp. NLF-1-9]QXL84177.1 BON domain-containing protein [Comamonas sp. NLF-1-9]